MKKEENYLCDPDWYIQTDRQTVWRVTCVSLLPFDAMLLHLLAVYLDAWMLVIVVFAMRKNILKCINSGKEEEKEIKEIKWTFHRHVNFLLFPWKKIFSKILSLLFRPVIWKVTSFFCYAATIISPETRLDVHWIKNTISTFVKCRSRRIGEIKLTSQQIFWL